MEAVNTFSMDNFPLRLTFVADLIYFDGPLLSLFKNESGDSYLYYWCDVDDNYNRWIIFRLSKAKLKSYIFKKISLNSLILNPIDGFLYIADINDDLQYRNIFLSPPDKLPESYVPEEDSYYDFESELDEDSRSLVINHIFDEKEIIKILLKILSKYDKTIKEIKNKLSDILFGIQKESIFRKGNFIGYNIQRQSLPGAYPAVYDENFLIDNSIPLTATNSEVRNEYQKRRFI